MTKGERVRLLRKEKKITGEEFGNIIGLKRNSVSQIENNINELTEQNAKTICREFHVNYAWLIDGVGEMYNSAGDALIDRLVDEYQLNEIQKRMIEAILELTDEQINMFTNKFFGFEVIKKENQEK